MELFIVDAFTDQIFGGNQAGVVLLNKNENFPEQALMQKIAAEIKHSETAFVKAIKKNIFQIKFYTPAGEVELCGHATISAFTVLGKEKKLSTGEYIVNTLAGNLKISVEPDFIWLQMAQGNVLKQFAEEDNLELYQACGVCLQDKPETMCPCIVNTGLSDILLPVNSKETLDQAFQNRAEIIRISKKYQVIGVHMFFFAASGQVTAYCRNFAPLYGIDEEAATGTSNGALTYYLFTMDLIKGRNENVFVQGESMGKPSVIKSRINGDKTIDIGGNAVVSVTGHLKL